MLANRTHENGQYTGKQKCG